MEVLLERPPGSGKDYLGYHALTQAAYRGIVRAAMDRAAAAGYLPGDHHFYVTFRTHQQGVQMDDGLKDKFPEEMTIVIQHQYEDFTVQDDWFGITLMFGGRPQPLRVPFGAVTRFFDPSTNFGVQIDPQDMRADDNLPAIVPPKRTAIVPAAAPAPAPEPSAEGKTVVSLDAFRRK
jgi:uncharacterized protein